MSNHHSPNQIRTFHWAWWIILLYFSTSIFVLLPVTLMLGVFGYLLYDLVRSGAGVGIVIFALFSPFILLVVLLWLWLLLSPFGRLFFSYFKVSPEGIQYRYWPTYDVRSTWSNVEKIGKYKSLGLIPYDVLYLKQAEPIGKPIMISLRSKLGLQTKYLVPLTGIHGWPEGELRNELQKYAPQLFENMSSNQNDAPRAENAG